jgi:hypothetical protein
VRHVAPDGSDEVFETANALAVHVCNRVIHQVAEISPSSIPAKPNKKAASLAGEEAAPKIKQGMQPASRQPRTTLAEHA